MENGNIYWRYIVDLLLDDEYYVRFIIDWIVGLIIGLRILIMNNTWIYYWMMNILGIYYLVGWLEVLD